MAEFFVTQGLGAAAANGGYPLGEDDGPIYSCDQATVLAGSPTIIHDNTVQGWPDVSIGDWLVWDVAGVAQHRRIVSTDDQSNGNITVHASCTAGASKAVKVGGAWNAFQAAFDRIQPGDLVNVRAGTYAAGATIVTAGTLSAPIRFRAYAASPGDLADGECPVVIDGNNAVASGIAVSGGVTNAYYVFEGIGATRVTNDGWAFSGKHRVRWRSCRAYVNGGKGFNVGNYCVLEGCNAWQNAHEGILMASGALVAQARAYLNGQANEAQVSVASGATVEFSTIHGFGQNVIGIKLNGTANQCLARNNTIDGGSVTGVVGIWSVGSQGARIYNNLFHRCPSEVLFSTDFREVEFVRNNRTAAADGSDFVDAANHDYRLAAGSPARGNGYPAYVDIGAEQSRNPGWALSGICLGMQT